MTHTRSEVHDAIVAMVAEIAERDPADLATDKPLREILLRSS